MSTITPGELAEAAQLMRMQGVAHFTYRGCEVTFFMPDAQPPTVAEGETEEAADKRVRRQRRQLAEQDAYGAA